jgi:lysozyme family protein
MTEQYRRAIAEVLPHEGGYAMVPGDRGGETYCGISRVHHPKWAGWRIVDIAKPLRWNQKIKDSVLEGLVLEFYYVEKWCRQLRADDIKDVRVATLLLDWQVHSGDVASKAVQRLVGVKPDGVIGPVTIAAINKVPGKQLFGWLKERRLMFLHGNVKAVPGNAKFLRGWLDRVNSFVY